MYEDNICSLCIAVIHKNTGNPFLFRIADMRDGRLDPFTLDDEGEYGQENIDLIYNPNVPAEGSVGFWDWYSEDARRQRSFPNNTYRWIEYVTFDDVLNAKEVLARLRSGIEGILGDHDYLFEYERCVDGTAYCFFVRGADFQKSINSATVKDDVVCLNVYKIPKESIHEIKTWHMPDFHKQYYANLEFGEVVHKEYVRSVDSIIKTLIQSRITTYVPSNKKSDKAAVRNFLNLIPDSPLVNMLAERLECDENKARTYVDDFLARCETYFNCEDYDAQIMQRLIDSDTKVAHLFKNQIQDEWEQQNRALLEKANQQLTGIQDKIMDLQAHIEGLEQEKATKESNIAELELNYKKLQQTAGDIESGVRDKINAATQDIAEFFSEYALFMPCQQIVGANSLTQIAPAREIFSNDPEIIKDPDVLWACLQDNLIASGVDRDQCKPLAAYLLAAYYTKVPLIVAGYGAEIILQAMSVTLTNKKVYQIYDVGETDAKALHQLPCGDIIAVYNNFDMTLINKIIAANPTLYVAIISTTAEELSIEPRGIYNYALPLFAEYYVNSEKTADMDGCVSHIDFKLQNGSSKKLLPNHVLPVYAKKRSDQLATAAMQIYPGITSFDLFILQAIPIMLSIEGREETAELISDAKLSDNEKKLLLRLVGERDA